MNVSSEKQAVKSALSSANHRLESRSPSIYRVPPSSKLTSIISHNPY